MADICKTPGFDKYGRKVLGVRKCKRIVKSLFPYLLIYLASYRRFRSFEILSCYRGDFDIFFRFTQDRFGNYWIHLSVYHCLSFASSEYWFELDSNLNIIAGMMDSYIDLCNMFSSCKY